MSTGLVHIESRATNRHPSASQSHDDGGTPVRHTETINLFKEDDPPAESEFANALHTFSTTLDEDYNKLIAAATASGRRLVDSGRLERAESLQNLILAVYRDSFGTGNKETLWAMRLRGNHNDALALMKEAIEQGHNVWTEDDLDARYFMHEVALELFRSIAQDFERILVLDNAETLTVIHNLAPVRMNLGDRKTAAVLFEKVWKTRRRVLGDEDPQTTHSLASLASLRLEQGMHQDAISLQRVVPDSTRKRFGEAHPDTLWAKAQLANTSRYTGNNDEAGTLFAQVLESRGQDFDEEGPEMLSAINDCANWLQDRGHAARAQPMFEKIWK
ncbi:LOW QUALITY PROTEIN: hypothetical protein ColTof4_01273 [Colletotrichum tofieldiae]|nr:LOW QUALITY PROTEIN: hypothetical protein ColTof4_01273 [Colletotrichum tofieldiae]